MKVKNIGLNPISIRIPSTDTGTLYDWSPNEEIEFPDKLKPIVDEAIFHYDDLIVTSDNEIEEAELDGKIPVTEKGAALGVATLDAGQKIPAEQLPNSVMEIQDEWNPVTNTPPLADGIGGAGDLYIVSVDGVRDLGSGSQNFYAGDFVIYMSGVWKKSSFSLAGIPDASTIVRGFVNLVAQSFSGLKTFVNGLVSEEEILVDSTVNAYGSIRTKNSVGADSKMMAVASGDAPSGYNSGDAVLASGSATRTAAPPMTFQGITFTQLSAFYGVGKSTNQVSVEFIIDNVNVTNPLAPIILLRGSASQRLAIRVNSATTIDDVVAAFPTSGFPTSAFTVSGSGTGTFTNGVQYFTGAVDTGEASLASDWRGRVSSNILVLGGDTNANGQVAINSSEVSGTDSSSTIFVMSGQVKGTGNSGSIAIRSADMQGNGASGAVFFRTGSVNGSLASGSTNISTGATTPYSTANSGGVNINSGAINGVSGNSGNVFVSSGFFASTTLSGTTGQVQIFSGNYAGNGSVSGGLIFVGGAGFTGAGSGTTSALSMRSGDKTNAGSTGNTGTLTVRSGNHAGTGNSGNAVFLSGSANNGNSGTADFGSGPVVNGASGSVSLRTGLHSGTTGSGTAQLSVYSGDITGALIGGTTGNVQINSGNVTNGTSTANSGDINISTGTVAGSGNRGTVNITGKYVQITSQVGGNIHLFTETNGAVAFFANGVLKGSVQTGNQAIGSQNVHLTFAASSQNDRVNLGVKGGNDSPSNGAGSVSIVGGFASNGSNNGGSVYIESGGHTSSGNGGDIHLILNGTTKGKIRLGQTSTVGYVWTATDTAGGGQWQTASGGASLGNLEVSAETLRPQVTGADIRVVTKDSGGFTGNVYINSGFQTAGGTSGTANLFSGGSNAATGDVNVYSSDAGTNFNSGSITIKTGLVGGTGVRGKIRFQDGTHGTIGHVWTSTGVNGEGSWSPASGGLTPAIKTNANNGETVNASTDNYCDTSTAAFTLNLPPSPSLGQRVRFFDKKGTWNTNNLTVGRNGNNIQGTPANFAANVNFGVLEFVYTDSTDGWLILNNA